jgi:hypothetical protein
MMQTTIEITVNEPTPETRAIGIPAGSPVTLADGREWLLSFDLPYLGSVWDALYDSNALQGKYDTGDVLTAAHRLVQANYRLTDEEAFELVHVDPRSLISAVERALYGPNDGHQTWSDWVIASLWANGINPTTIPRARLHKVLDLLEAIKRTIPAEQYVSSQAAMAARRQLFQSING